MVFLLAEMHRMESASHVLDFSNRIVHLFYIYLYVELFLIANNDLKSLLYSRLDLVPINRSVGLKAKPTKPVTEVLRPVVAKYGLNLNHLVARLVS